MNLKQACDLFHNYGNAGKSADDLETTAPTLVQLETARQVALSNVNEAFRIIRQHFKIGLDYPADGLGE